MAEEKKANEIKYRFEEVDDETVAVSVLNGAEPFNVTLQNVTWGMLEDIMSVQDAAKDDPRAIFKFLNEYIEGGARAIPLKRTT